MITLQANASYTPDSPVTLVISNTAQEISGQGSENEFTDYATLNATLTERFAKITNSTDILDIVYALYPAGASAQHIFDTVVSDMRATCPINRVSMAMSQSSHHNIYRLYITNKMEGFPYYPAFHGWETFAFFDFRITEFFFPQSRDLLFAEAVKAMVKKLAWEGTVGWGAVPAAMDYGNTDDIINVLTEMPQTEVCDKLAELDLVKYGWQNK